MSLSKSTKISLCILMLLTFVILLAACNVAGGITMSYTNANRYAAASSGEISAVGGLNLDIDWINGAVSIRNDDDAQRLTFEEIAEGETLTTATTLHYFLDGNTLRIKYAQSGRTKIGRLKKYLNIVVPTNMSLMDIEIDSTSCDILIDTVTAREVELDSVSGNVSVTCDAVEVDADTDSGFVSIAGNISKVGVDTVSGSVTVKAEPCLYDLEVDTVSGDVNLLLYLDNGFRLEFDTISGLFTNAFNKSDMIVMRNIYTYRGGGICNYEVDTVSGTLTLNSVYIPPVE